MGNLGRAFAGVVHHRDRRVWKCACTLRQTHKVIRFVRTLVEFAVGSHGSATDVDSVKIDEIVARLFRSTDEIFMAPSRDCENAIGEANQRIALHDSITVALVVKGSLVWIRSNCDLFFNANTDVSQVELPQPWIDQGIGKAQNHLTRNRLLCFFHLSAKLRDGFQLLFEVLQTSSVIFLRVPLLPHRVA